MSILLWLSAALALGSACLTFWNLRLLQRPSGVRRQPRDQRLVSVLIPARNEVGNIGPAIEAILASTHTRLELIVLDDGSTDGTELAVMRLVRRDPRVRLRKGAALPGGWQGKVFACHQLAEAARGDVLVFVDADVRLAPTAIATLTAALGDTDAALISGIPHQTTGSIAEHLIVPLMHFVLYGYLPLALMRERRDPSLAAACGQLIATTRAAYHAAGGHAAIAHCVHDGIALARQFRARGLKTDLIDADEFAECRMYRSWREVLAGFSKNAHEGLGSPRGLMPWTLILLFGQTLPAFALLGSLAVPAWRAPAVLAAAAVYAARIALGRRFRHEALSVLLHPLGVLVLVGIQWYALLRRALKLPLMWRQRNVSLS
jgi:Glycosyl transferase family 2